MEMAPEEADDGILSDDEINQSHVVCNGAPGPAGRLGQTVSKESEANLEQKGHERSR